MSTTRKYALWGGLAYLATFVFSIPTLGMKADIADNLDFVLGNGAEGPVIWAAVFDIVTALAGIVAAVALYPVVKRHGRSGAIGFISSRTLEAAMLFAGALALLSVVTLRQDLTGTADPDTLVVAGKSLVALHDWAFLLGPAVMAPVNAFFLGSVLYRSRLVPRILPTLGLVGAPLLLASSLAVALGAHDQISGTAMLATLPIAAWELSLGVYLTVKGFRSDPVATVEAPAPVERELVSA